MFTCLGEGQVWRGQEAGSQGKQAHKQEKGNVTTYLLIDGHVSLSCKQLCPVLLDFHY